MRTPLSALISSWSTKAWEAVRGHGWTPHTHSQVYFEPQDPPPPTTPPLCLTVKPEPVNGWGGVSLDKWHQTPASLLSCHHILDCSVWSHNMCWGSQDTSHIQSIPSFIQPFKSTAGSMMATTDPHANYPQHYRGSIAMTFLRVAVFPLTMKLLLEILGESNLCRYCRSNTG